MADPWGIKKVVKHLRSRLSSRAKAICFRSEKGVAGRGSRCCCLKFPCAWCDFGVLEMAEGREFSPTDVLLFSWSATLSINGRRCRKRAECGRPVVVLLFTLLLELMLRLCLDEPRVLYGVALFWPSVSRLSTEWVRFTELFSDRRYF